MTHDVNGKRHRGPGRYVLRDVEEPNLLRRFFPYSEVPRIGFGLASPPPQPAPEFYVTDSTLRDGQQARSPFTVEQIGRIFDFLHRLSGRRNLIRQAEFFLYTKKDRQALDLCRSRGYAAPEVTGWIRAREKDLQLVHDAKLGETGILTSASDYHIFLKLKSTRRKAMDEYLRIVCKALDLGIIPRCAFEDVTRADVYGFCVPFALELMRLRRESGMDIKVRLCDTLGLGVPYPGAALPRGVPALVRAFVEDAGVPEHLLEWHGHNDFHRALVNTTTAWLYGCSGGSGTLFGLGERTGNAPVEALLVEYSYLKEIPGVLDRKVLSEARTYFHSHLGGIADTGPFPQDGGAEAFSPPPGRGSGSHDPHPAA